jgi:hypothetical protein
MNFISKYLDTLCISESPLFWSYDFLKKPIDEYWDNAFK